MRLTHGPRQRVTLLAGAILSTVAMLGAAAETASATASGVSCTTYRAIPVSLAAGQPASATVFGELCATRAELTNGETVQLLLHGATYNHTYWDFGTFDGLTCSYARDVAAAGFPTFAIDAIGAGNSSHPASTSITFQTAAFVAHEIVQDLRQGTVGATKFGKVMLVGHSLGSGVAWLEASTYQDVAGAITTGAEHTATVFAQNSLADFHPTNMDPKFAGSGLDSGYLTTVPGKRQLLFYNSADSDPNVIAQDEATKDTASLTQLTGELPVFSTPSVTQAITVPVMEIVGSNDQLFCGPESGGGTFDCSSGAEVASEEAADYSAAARLRACVVPGSGHDVNLALNHGLEEADAIAWSYEYVGQFGIPPVGGGAPPLPPDCS
jgi:pimeloyl-ACP methyl ester carboxylesterase